MRNLVRDRRGGAALETVYVLPVLFLLLLGFLDVVYLGRGHLRVQSAAAQVGQVISQCKSVGGNDEEGIKKLAQGALGSFAAPGKQWAVVVTAIRLDSKGKPDDKWTMDSRTQDPKTKKMVPEFTTKGATVPSGFTLEKDVVLFRTEVFARVDATLFSRANSLLAARMGSRPEFENAVASVLHVSRASDADKLNTKTSSEACL